MQTHTGDVERDFWLALDLLNSQKDHVEFTLVRDWIEASLKPLSESVTVEVPKSVLKQGAVQHLYGRLAARLKEESNDAHLLQVCALAWKSGRVVEAILVEIQQGAVLLNEGCLGVKISK